VIEIETTNQRLETIEQEAAEKTKRSVKRLVHKLSSHPDFPSEWSDRKGPIKGFLLYTLPGSLTKALFVTSQGLFTSYSDLQSRPYGHMEEATPEIYRKYSPDVLKRLEEHFNRKAMLRERIERISPPFGFSINH